MKQFGLLVGLAVAAMGASTLSAADYYGRDFRQDYRQVEGMRESCARDRARLNEDMRRGRWRAVEEDRRQLARDERALAEYGRDTRFDRREYGRDYREPWRY